MAPNPAPSPPATSTHSQLSVPSTPSRLRGHSPIREKFEEKFEHFRTKARRVRSRSSASSNSNNDAAESILSNAIFNVGTTSAAVGGGQGFHTTYDNARKTSKDGRLSLNDDTAQVIQHPDLNPPVTVAARHTQEESRAPPDLRSIRSSLTTISFKSQESWHTARERTLQSTVDEDGAAEDAPALWARFPVALFFMRHLSAFLARANVDLFELFIEEPQIAEDDSASLDSGSTTSGRRRSIDDGQSESLLTNVLNITAYRSDTEKPPVQMRALLDTGNNGHNIMSKAIAELIGHDIEEVTPEFGAPPLLLDGEELSLMGIVRVRWYFSEAKSTKSYEVVFQVVEDEVPFDVALCYDFLREERILRMDPHFAMTLGAGRSHYSGASTEAQRREQARKDAERRAKQAEERRKREAAERARKREAGRR